MVQISIQALHSFLYFGGLLLSGASSVNLKSTCCSVIGPPSLKLPPSTLTQHNMHFSTLLSLGVTIILTTARAAVLPGNDGVQVPIGFDNGPTTMTKTSLRTRYVINVVSAEYRYRSSPDGAGKSTSTIAHPPAQQTWYSGQRDEHCEMDACSICRKLNNCPDELSTWYVKRPSHRSKVNSYDTIVPIVILPIIASRVSQGISW